MSKNTQTPNKKLTDLNQKKHRDFTSKQKEKIIVKGNPPLDNNVIKGYN